MSVFDLRLSKNLRHQRTRTTEHTEKTERRARISGVFPYIPRIPWLYSWLANIPRSGREQRAARQVVGCVQFGRAAAPRGLQQPRLGRLAALRWRGRHG